MKIITKFGYYIWTLGAFVVALEATEIATGGADEALGFPPVPGVSLPGKPAAASEPEGAEDRHRPRRVGSGGNAVLGRELPLPAAALRDLLVPDVLLPVARLGIESPEEEIVQQLYRVFQGPVEVFPGEIICVIPEDKLPAFRAAFPGYPATVSALTDYLRGTDGMLTPRAGVLLGALQTAVVEGRLEARPDGDGYRIISECPALPVLGTEWPVDGGADRTLAPWWTLGKDGWAPEAGVGAGDGAAAAEPCDGVRIDGVFYPVDERGNLPGAEFFAHAEYS